MGLSVTADEVEAKLSARLGALPDRLKHDAHYLQLAIYDQLVRLNEHKEKKTVSGELGWRIFSRMAAEGYATYSQAKAEEKKKEEQQGRADEEKSAEQTETNDTRSTGETLVGAMGPFLAQMIDSAKESTAEEGGTPKEKGPVDFMSMLFSGIGSTTTDFSAPPPMPVRMRSESADTGEVVSGEESDYASGDDV